jgi:hypothetical protein
LRFKKTNEELKSLKAISQQALKFKLEPNNNTKPTLSQLVFQACPLSTINKQEVRHIVALPFTLKKKKYLKAKEELWKLKYFTIAKINLIFLKTL